VVILYTTDVHAARYETHWSTHRPCWCLPLSTSSSN